MDLAAVMDAVGDRLDTIAGLRVFRYPPDSLSPPAAVIGYPDSYTFDETYGRGMDRMTLPVILVVGKVPDRAARNTLLAYVKPTGATSVKAVLESGSYSAFHTIRVASVEFDVVTIAATDYLAALFSIDIAGSGA